MSMANGAAWARRLALAAMLAGGITAPALAQVVGGPPNPNSDFPTQARVEYVMSCMETNGRSPESLRKCSCSLDFIDNQLTYDDYVSVETAMTFQNISGERAGAMKDIAWVKDLIDRFRRVQVDADLECFSRQ